MSRYIRSSVGQGGANRGDDVSTVQELLNQFAAHEGGPRPPLDVDGDVGPKTVSAIRQFQSYHFKWADGRVDPDNRTIWALNEYDATVDASLPYMALGIVPKIAQPSNMTCWATVGTMLMSWKLGKSLTIEEAMNRAGKTYRGMYDRNEGLPPNMTQQFASASGMSVEPGMCYTVRGWLNILKRHGAFGVVTLEAPGLHARVVRGMEGDSILDGTFMKIVDPDGGVSYDETLRVFDQKYEQAASDGMFQIWHF